MTNNKLIFGHQIPIEVSAECDTSVQVLVNDRPVWENKYKKGLKHNEVIEFDEDYKDAKKNKLTFLFSGTDEVEKKYLKIFQITMNKQIFNLYNAEYFPNINREWWEQLTPDQKDYYNQVIYGKTGSEYGWYGEINFYYCTGFDFRSKTRYNQNTTDKHILLGEKQNWIYLDQDSNGVHNKTK